MKVESREDYGNLGRVGFKVEANGVKEWTGVPTRQSVWRLSRYPGSRASGKRVTCKSGVRLRSAWNARVPAHSCRVSYHSRLSMDKMRLSLFVGQRAVGHCVIPVGLTPGESGSCWAQLFCRIIMLYCYQIQGYMSDSPFFVDGTP